MEFDRRFGGFFVSMFVFTNIYRKSLSVSIQNINSLSVSIQNINMFYDSVILRILFTQADMNLSVSKESFL